jgi:3'-5' exoribonuclease
VKQQYATALTAGERVDSVFVLRSKEMRAARTGEAYLSFEFADRSGRIAGIMFRPTREAEAVPAGTVVRVRGTVTSYRGVTRVSAEAIRPVAEFDRRDLVPAGPRDEKELIGELRALVRSVKDSRLSAVLRAVFGDREFMARFKEAPASQGHHHAYLGGLLEHTVSVANLCGHLSAAYPQVNADLLVTGALLHDIGKVDEIEVSTGIGYTDEGRLLGHIYLGERRVRAAIDGLPESVPSDVVTQLSHVLLTHHGEMEWGSPKRPATLEALLLHHADNLDAKAAGFISATASASLVEEPWTDAGNLFRRPLWAPRAVEDDRPSAPTEDEQYARSA